MAINHSKSPDYYFKDLYEASAAYRPSFTNSTFPHQPEYSHCGVMMISNARNTNIMLQTSHDSGCGSEIYSATGLLPESLHIPTWIQDFDGQNFEDQFKPVWSHGAPRGSSRSPPRPSKRPEKAPNTTSSSPSNSPKPKPYCCMWPRCETTFARAYDLGRHQKTKHTNAKRFDCPEENCRRYGIPLARSERGGFTRLDHFRDHVKNIHGKIVIKDKGSNGGQHWVSDPNDIEKRLWMRDETGSIVMKYPMGTICLKDSQTGLWRQIS